MMNEIKIKIDKGENLDVFVDEIIRRINDFGNEFNITGYEMLGALEIIRLDVIESLKDE